MQVYLNGVKQHEDMLKKVKKRNKVKEVLLNFQP